MNRRTFVQYSATTSFAIAALGLSSCTSKGKKPEQPETMSAEDPFFKLSLAQWSLHNGINETKTVNPMDFAKKAKSMGFQGLEYVNHLYANELNRYGSQSEAVNKVFSELKMRSEDEGMRNLIIMVDGEGDFAITDERARIQAVENHHKWVEAAAMLGCHSVRVNLFGEMDPQLWKETAADALSRLCDYAKPFEINILVENHGYLSSDAKLLIEVMKLVNRDNCGVLPDFGNFCLRREGNARWGAPCVEEYDRYVGVEELMPYAKGVSAKSYDFDAAGNETTIDYTKMMQIVHKSGYRGFVGVEYEGTSLSEDEGIIRTKELLLQVAAAM